MGERVDLRPGVEVSFTPGMWRRCVDLAADAGFPVDDYRTTATGRAISISFVLGFLGIESALDEEATSRPAPEVPS